MTVNNPPNLELSDIARQAMLSAGFLVDPTLQPAELSWPVAEEGIPDLRSLLWSSIDNPESRDLDQVEVADCLPDGGIQIRLGIADVDFLVPKGCALDLRAAHNTTSVYTGVVTFPMFPPRISDDLTSLLEGQDRLAVIVTLRIANDGGVTCTSVERGMVRNHAKLVYGSVGAWLENTAPAPQPIANSADLADQITLQATAAERLYAQRIRAGALEFETIEPRPVMKGGKVVGLEVKPKNKARMIIENLMVATNSAIASFLERQGWPSIQRVVRTPERWSRIVAVAAQHGETLPATPNSVALAAFLEKSRRAHPDTFADLSLAIVKLIGAGEYVVVRNANEAFGHFGLAVQDYTHATAPNRRYADLIIQRLLKAAIAGEPCPYTAEELEVIAARCNQQATAARKVDRFMRKVAGASLLSTRIGETFDAMVTGASPKGVFVRIKHPPVEGRVVRGEAGMDVGEKVRVRLDGVDAERGFVDFVRVRSENR